MVAGYTVATVIVATYLLSLWKKSKN